MKKIINILIIFFGIICNAQIIVPLEYDNFNNLENGNYLKDVNGYLDKFTGTWKYVNGTEEFIVKIEKAEHVEYSMFYSDRLCGGYKYIKNGIVKADRLNIQCNDRTNPQNFGYFGGSSLSNDYQRVGLPGSDVVGKREVRIKLEVIPNTDPVQMRWKMENRENFVINNKGFKQGTEPGIPKDIILIKQ